MLDAATRHAASGAPDRAAAPRTTFAAIAFTVLLMYLIPVLQFYGPDPDPRARRVRQPA